MVVIAALFVTKANSAVMLTTYINSLSILLDALIPERIQDYRKKKCTGQHRNVLKNYN